MDCLIFNKYEDVKNNIYFIHEEDEQNVSFVCYHDGYNRLCEDGLVDKESMTIIHGQMHNVLLTSHERAKMDFIIEHYGCQVMSNKENESNNEVYDTIACNMFAFARKHIMNLLFTKGSLEHGALVYCFSEDCSIKKIVLDAKTKGIYIYEKLRDNISLYNINDAGFDHVCDIIKIIGSKGL